MRSALQYYLLLGLVGAILIGLTLGVGPVFGLMGAPAEAPATGDVAPGFDDPASEVEPRADFEMSGHIEYASDPEHLLATQSTRVTLITGTEVEVSETDDQLVVELLADEGQYQQHTDGAAIYLYPEAFDPDRHDRELFNITRLVDEGHGTEEDPSIPVIVDLDEGVSTSTASVDGLADATTFDHIGAVAGDIHPGDDAAGTLGGDGLNAAEIDQLILDRPVEVSLDESIEEIEVESGAWEAKDVDGAGVNVSVLDTGIDSDHPDFGDRVIVQEDFTGERTTDDLHGHGTHVAGIVAGAGTESDGEFTGVAPEANLFDMRVLGADGTGSSSDIIAAIERSIELEADVISMSLGAGSSPDGPLKEVVDEAVDAGIVVIAAAGNTGPGEQSMSAPANIPSAIAIGADDTLDHWTDGDLAEFSSRGPTVEGHVGIDVTAPGVEIRAPGSTDADEWPYTAKSGTSMATPHVAGLTALLLEDDPSLDHSAVRSHLVTTADPLSSDYDGTEDLTVFDMGAGQVNATALFDPPVIVDQPSIGFDFELPDHGEERTTVVTIENPTEDEQTIHLEHDVEHIEEGIAADLTMNQTTISLGPGETAAVAVTVNASNPEAGWYGGTIDIEAGDFDGALLVGFQQPPPRDELIKITKTPIDDRDMDAEPVSIQTVSGEGDGWSEPRDFNEDGSIYVHPQSEEQYTVMTGGFLESDEASFSLMSAVVDPAETDTIEFDETTAVPYELDFDPVESQRGDLVTALFEVSMSSPFAGSADDGSTPTQTLRVAAVGGAADDNPPVALMDGPSFADDPGVDGVWYELRQITHPNETREPLENWGIQNDRVYDVLTSTTGVDGPHSVTVDEEDLREVNINYRHSDPSVTAQNGGPGQNDQSVYRLLHAFEQNNDVGIDSSSIFVTHLELGAQTDLDYYTSTDDVASKFSIRSVYDDTEYDHSGYRFNGPLVREPPDDPVSYSFNNQPGTPVIASLESSIGLASDSAVAPDETMSLNETHLFHLGRWFADSATDDGLPHGVRLRADQLDQFGYSVSHNGETILEDASYSMTTYVIDEEFDDPLEAGDMLEIELTAALDPLGAHDTRYEIEFDPDGVNAPPELARVEVQDLDETSTGLVGPTDAIVDITNHADGDLDEVTAYYADEPVTSGPFDGDTSGWQAADIEQQDDGTFALQAEVDDDLTLSLAIAATDAAGNRIESTHYDVANWEEPTGMIIESIDIDSTPVSDEPFDISAAITNHALDPAEQDVEIRLDGSVINSSTLSMAARETTTITTEEVVDEPGTYTLTVVTEDEQTSTEFEVHEPAFYAIDITEAPGLALPDDDISLTASIENIGGVDGTQDILFEVGDTLVDSKAGIDLAPGESTTVSFDTPASSLDPGVHTVTVASEDGEDTVSVEVLEPAYFEVEVIDASMSVVQGDSAEFDITVTNDGDAPDTQAITLSHDGEVIDSTELASLEGGDDQTISLSMPTSDLDPGSYNVTIASGNETVPGTVEVVDPDSTFEVVDTDIEPTTVATGEDATVTVTVEDIGTEGGEATVTAVLGDDLVTESVTESVDPGGETEIEIDLTAPDTTDSFDVEVHVDGVAAPSEVSLTVEESADDIPAFGPLLAIGALAGVAMYVMRRRK